MPDNFEQTRLWRSTLAQQPTNDVHAAERERLRASFLAFRSRVAAVAAEIHRVMPDYTVHDITHLDALWEIAELVAGPEFTLTPTDGFVLGGAFLLHDLGMALASYPGGLADLKRERSWSDIVCREFTLRMKRRPTVAEIETPPREVQDAAVAALLRLLHARHAEQLATIAWRLSPTDPPQYLIEDTEIRQAFGRIIGRIAHSHWWAVEKLTDEFSRSIGAPHWCPHEWTVDPLKLAALLRVADAAHIDARRAPMFLRRIRRPSGTSDAHWSFQEKLQKPQVRDDAIVYTSGYAFPFHEAAAWWLCLDTLKMVDDELRRVDAILAESKLPRFLARRVAGIDPPERLVAYIPTDGWLPVDAALQVSDLPRLVQNLGGAELYGRDLRVPVRELIQNAADGVRARRVVEERDTNWGSIHVTLGTDDRGDWIEVRDDGIGMSRDVLTRYLLDFGTSYWSSSQVIDDFPGLLSSGFIATGRYGIGFFSVFMLGDSVRVVTRRFDSAQSDTVVLEFNTGVAARPILRPAATDERLRDGGTAVRVWLRTPAANDHGLLWRRQAGVRTLSALCAQLAPALDVRLVANEHGVETVAVEASDWTRIDGCDLLRRIFDWESRNDKAADDPECAAYIQSVAANLRFLRDGDTIIGRAAAVSPYHRLEIWLDGVVTVGGLAASPLRGIAGVLIGVSKRASRDIGRPAGPPEVFAGWSSEQAVLAPALYTADADLLHVAGIVWCLGGDPGSLPVATNRYGFRSLTQIAQDVEAMNEVLVVSNYEYEQILGHFPDAVFMENAIFTEMGINVNASARGYAWDSWPMDLNPQWIDSDHWFTMASLMGAVLTALANAWHIPLEVLLETCDFRFQEDRVVAADGERQVKAGVQVVRRPTMP